MLSSPRLASAADRPVILRRRPDLVVRTDRYEGRTFVMVKDPVRLRYFRFREEEYRLLQLLDGQRSLQEIKRTFESEFKPQRLRLQELQAFISQLHQTGLVLSDAVGQGATLDQRGAERATQDSKSRWLNPLYIKLPGFDPERLLKRMYPYFRWIYSPAAVAAAVLLMISAAALVAVNFDEFRGKPELINYYAFLNVYTIFWFWVAMGGVKVLHEFGHGLTCTHYGGECHEMGGLLLVFSPGMYCNVSDAWMLPNKWHRIWISAAGIYVEAVLASLATWIWWYSSPGLIHSLSFAVMFVCSVNTVLVNANPLMRYDGYYVLVDLLEIPNLRQKATTLLQTTIAEVCLGLPVRRSSFAPKKGGFWFVLYAIATNLYLWLVTGGVLWYLYGFLRPYKLGAIGALLALMSLVSLTVGPIVRMAQFVAQQKGREPVNKVRLTLTGLALAGVVLGALYIPLPLRVVGVCVVEPRGAEQLYVPVAGTLKAVHVHPGQVVAAGDLLAEFVNPELEVEHERLQRAAQTLQASLRTYRALDEPGQLRQGEAALRETEIQLQKRATQLAQLTVRAPRAGRVFAAPEKDETSLAQELENLPDWQRSPLHPENIGGHFRAGTLICSIGDANQMEAHLAVDQADIEWVRRDQPVLVQLDALPLATLRSSVGEIAEREMREAPIQLTNRGGGELATETDPKTGHERPLGAVYQARVPLPEDAGWLRPGLKGRARIDCGTWTGYQWIRRYFLQTFHFRIA